MYNQILKIITEKDLSAENPWASFVYNNFSAEQIFTLDFILESFPENLIFTDGIPNASVISVLVIIAYTIGNSREFIKNLKNAKDITFLYDSLISNNTTILEAGVFKESIVDPTVGDTVLEEGRLYRYSVFTWDSGSPCPNYLPTNPSEGDAWYNETENKVYIFDGASWGSGLVLPLKEPANPCFSDMWINAKNNILYRYNQAYWEEVLLPGSNLKLLFSLLDDNKFYLLFEENSYEENENIIKTFKNTGLDSYLFIKNIGTISTVKRLIEDYLLDVSGQRLDFTISSSEVNIGEIDIDIPELVNYGLQSLVVTPSISGSAGNYTYGINKESGLYKYLMKIKPAGIYYNIISTGNDEYSIIVPEPIVTFISADYFLDTYTISIKNTSTKSFVLTVEDKLSGGSYPVYPTTYSPILPGEYRIITREADNTAFSTNGISTVIKVTFTSDSTSTSHEYTHVADSVLLFTSESLSLLKYHDAYGYNGYAEATITNSNNKSVTANISIQWDSGPVITSLTSIAANTTKTFKYYNTDYNLEKDFNISVFFSDPEEEFSISPTQANSELEIMGIPKLDFVSVSIENITKYDGGYARITAVNPNSIDVNLRTAIRWLIEGNNYIASYPYRTILANDSITFDIKNTRAKGDAYLNTYLIDSSSYYENSESLTDEAEIEGKALSFFSSNVTITKGSDYAFVSVVNTNSIPVYANMQYTWSIGNTEFLGNYNETFDYDFNDNGFINTQRFGVESTIDLSSYNHGDIFKIIKGYLELLPLNLGEDNIPDGAVALDIAVEAGHEFNYTELLGILETDYNQYYQGLITNDLPGNFYLRVQFGASSYVYYKSLYENERDNYYYLEKYGAESILISGTTGSRYYYKNTAESQDFSIDIYLYVPDGRYTNSQIVSKSVEDI